MSLDAALQAALVAALRSPEGQAALRQAIALPVVPALAGARVKVRRAAELADCCPDTVRKAIKEKQLKATKPQGSREWLVDVLELQRWMGERSAPRRGEVDNAAAVDEAVARARKAWK
jgi:hypothetical protein